MDTKPLARSARVSRHWASSPPRPIRMGIRWRAARSRMIRRSKFTKFQPTIRSGSRSLIRSRSNPSSPASSRHQAMAVWAQGSSSPMTSTSPSAVPSPARPTDQSVPSRSHSISRDSRRSLGRQSAALSLQSRNSRYPSRRTIRPVKARPPRTNRSMRYRSWRRISPSSTSIPRSPRRSSATCRSPMVRVYTAATRLPAKVLSASGSTETASPRGPSAAPARLASSAATKQTVRSPSTRRRTGPPSVATQYSISVPPRRSRLARVRRYPCSIRSSTPPEPISENMGIQHHGHQ